MEKNKQYEKMHQVENKGGEVGNRVLTLINETIKNPGDNFSNRINYIIEKAIKSTRQHGDIMDEICQKRIFEEVCVFLNSLFKECQIKKFYNNIPNIDIKQFGKKNLGEQFTNNIYGKERKLFYREELKGGSCHHRTILLKNLFDTLEANGLKIENRIVAYNNVSGHSGLLIKFQNNDYIADIHGFNENVKKIISSTDELNQTYKTKEFSKFSFKKKEENGKMYFDAIDQFTEYINNRRQTTATIEFKPRLENNEEIPIKIEFLKGYILLTINDKIYKYHVNNFEKDEIYKSKYDAIEYVLKNTHGPKEHKQELGKYLHMIINKINRDKIYNMYKE